MDQVHKIVYDIVETENNALHFLTKIKCFFSGIVGAIVKKPNAC